MTFGMSPFRLSGFACNFLGHGCDLSNRLKRFGKKSTLLWYIIVSHNLPLLVLKGTCHHWTFLFAPVDIHKRKQLSGPLVSWPTSSFDHSCNHFVVGMYGYPSSIAICKFHKSPSKCLRNIGWKVCQSNVHVIFVSCQIRRLHHACTRGFNHSFNEWQGPHLDDSP